MIWIWRLGAGVIRTYFAIIATNMPNSWCLYDVIDIKSLSKPINMDFYKQSVLYYITLDRNSLFMSGIFHHIHDAWETIN